MVDLNMYHERYGAIALSGGHPDDQKSALCVCKLLKQEIYGRLFISTVVENENIIELVEAAGRINQRWHVVRWYGDKNDNALMGAVKQFRLSKPEKEQLISLVEPHRTSPTVEGLRVGLPLLKKLFDNLTMEKDPKIQSYLGTIEGAGINTVRLGQYPLVEACCMAALEMKAFDERPDQRDYHGKMQWQELRDSKNPNFSRQVQNVNPHTDQYGLGEVSGPYAFLGENDTVDNEYPII